MSAYKLNEEELKNVIGGEGRWACKPPSQVEVERAEQKWAAIDNDYQVQIATLDVARDKEDMERLMKVCNATEEEIITMAKVFGKKAPAAGKTITIKVE